MQNKKLSFTALASAMVFALAACGGGGGDEGGSDPAPSNPPVEPQPAPPTSVPPSTTAPTPTYPAGDQRLVAYETLNSLRLKLGVGVLRQDEALDRSADSHLGYMAANNVVAHEEEAGKPGFTGVNPYEQGVAAGADRAQWIAQVAGGAPDGLECALGFANSVYHLQGITGVQETVGIAVRDNLCVINFGVITGANGSGNGLPTWGGQQMSAGNMTYFPFDNDTVIGSFNPAAERPNPAPDLTMAGRPVMFRVPATSDADALTVNSFTLAGPNGAAIPVRVLVAPNAKTASAASVIEDANVVRGVAFMLPIQPLPAGVYTATFSGARNGIPVSKTWSFTAF